LQTAETIVRAPAEKCFELFCDPKLLPHLIPAIKRVKVVRSRPDGRALEVLFEGETLSYSVVYEYDVAARRVTWEPGIGRRDSVRGFAEFHAEGTGCKLRYGVASTTRRLDPDEASLFVAAFAQWVEAPRRR
jgi:hypothetical protein